MGDLNATEESEVVQTFLTRGFSSAFPSLHPGDETGTFNGFQDPSGGERIDHILSGPGIHSLKAAIVGKPVDGVWPSDHFPVVATISTRGPTGHPQS
jgi:endonuclease/exonuclease/phosphatase family metal-dependent hydrolase